MASPPAVVAPAATPAAASPEIARSRPTAERGALQVTVDRAKVIRLPERTQTVVIGNPAIADMAIQKNGIVVVTGKSYGTTNLIALDATGNVLAESTVSVAAATDAVIVVQRGLERQSYSCTPKCQPSVALGDANTYFSENRGQAESRNQFATSK
ncbi:pilus assembly protein N-terminal domain-containing protein [uncultured Enterovirga sp.]|uniref:pilus assembly protein N-terminal domain-containing protein n=1 Tax=uncultured Enterovirga sp. TaxID=2026352 RepID=UPI0035CA16F5